MIQNEINARIAAFVKDLEGLFAREALAAVSAALGRGVAPTAGASAPRARAARPAKAGKRTRVAAAPKAPSKASPEAASIDGAVLEFVKANPGAGVEQMVKALKVPTVKLKVRVASLVAAKSIRKTGKTRGTRYFPA